MNIRFLIDDQGRTKKRLKPLYISPTIRREMHGNEPRVVEPLDWEKSEREDEVLTKPHEVKIEGKPFNYVSLFSGIGGFEQALNKLGGTCVLASEIDKFANQAYEVLYGHPTVGDVTKVEAEDVPDHDLLVGGFPCQAFSVAGKRGGFDDARGTLFFEVARIAAVKQPKLLLLENVKGLVSHDKGKTLDTIVQTLNQIGYHVDFNVLNSKYFGVPQNRERIFIVAIRDDLAVSEPWIIEGTNVVAKGKRRISEYEDVKTFNFDWPEQNSVTTRLRDVLEPIVDERYYLSDEKAAKLVAQLEAKEAYEVRATALLNANMQGRRIKENDESSFTVSATDRHGVCVGGLPIREATKQGYAMAAVGDAVNFQFPGSTTRRGRVGKQIAQTLEASGVNQGVVEAEVRGIVAKSRPNTEIGITFKENGDIRPHRMDARKSGISELNINYENNPSFTVTSAHAPKIYGETTRYRIRKLTPLECFRLQGFPDSTHQALVDAGISNSQRYKMAGNAVTVNVIEAIGERLLPYLERPYSAPSLPAESSANSKACAPSTV